MGFGGFLCNLYGLCEFCVFHDGSVVAFVIFFCRVGVVLLWLCVFFLICFVVCVCIPVVSLNAFLCFVVCALSCLCNGLWWPCWGRFMMCILYVVLALVLVGWPSPAVCVPLI